LTNQIIWSKHFNTCLSMHLHTYVPCSQRHDMSSAHSLHYCRASENGSVISVKLCSLMFSHQWIIPSINTVSHSFSNNHQPVCCSVSSVCLILQGSGSLIFSLSSLINSVFDHKYLCGKSRFAQNQQYIFYTFKWNCKKKFYLYHIILMYFLNYKHNDL